MSSFRWRPLSGAAMLGLVAFALPAQQFTAHVGYVYPAGGRQGTTFEVIVGGQYLDGVNEAYVSGTGVQAAIARLWKPMTQGMFNKLRDELQELTAKRKKSALTPEEETRAETIRKQLGEAIRRPQTPAIAEQAHVLVTIAPDAPIGDREIRLATPNGLSNPLLFRVGQFTEHVKKPAKPIGDRGIAAAARYRSGAQDEGSGIVEPVALPAVINGQIMPGKVDRHRFIASKGQKLVVEASARELVPYISDAVPGWFQAVVALYDSNGKEVAYAGSYRFHPDPVLYYEIAEDGEYSVEIKDSIFRGREDFVYRIAISESPFITGMFPLGGKAGSRTPVQLLGWNLPSARITPNAKDAGIQKVTVRKGDISSNLMHFAVDNLPEREEKEPNNVQKQAVAVKFPIIVNGRIQQAGDVDVYRVDGKAGQELVAEVFARRLDSPLDSLLKLTDSSGKQIAINDDHEDKGTGLLTHHADSRIRVKLPANGAYYLHVADAQRKGGPEYAYRLRIAGPQPDFELRVVPASINARGATTVPVTVYALRKDGFNGDIALKLKDAPRGYVLSGGWVPAGRDKVRLTLTVPATKTEVPLRLHLEGRAVVQGKEVAKLAVPAEDMMQAFAYRHLVPAREWVVRVTPPGRARYPWRVQTDKPVRLASGVTTPVQVFMPLGNFASQIRVALNEPPEGIAIKKVTPSKEGLAIELLADAGKVKPGLKGNLILDAFMEGMTPGTSKKKAATGSKRFPIGTLPAIPFEVVASAR